MDIRKEFAPVTITLNTRDDFIFFRNLIRYAQKGKRNPFYNGPQKDEFDHKLVYLERELS